jgi:hypothetical protein
MFKSSASSGMGIVDIERDRARSSGIDDRTSFAIAKLSETKQQAAQTDLAISPHRISFDPAQAPRLPVFCYRFSVFSSSGKHRSQR